MRIGRGRSRGHRTRLPVPDASRGVRGQGLRSRRQRRTRRVRRRPAASLRQQPGDATTDAQHTADANLIAAGVSCLDLTTTVDTHDFHPGGTVTVTVRCEASMADVTLLGVPGRRTFTATAVEVIDTYRSGAT